MDSLEKPVVPLATSGLLKADSAGGYQYPGHGQNAEIGVAVSHGFTGSTQDVLPWAQALAAQGYAVRVPLLPGHGTSWRDLQISRWRQWATCYEAAYLELRGQTRLTFTAGLSMGGTLALRTASTHGACGVLAVNPALSFYDRRVKAVALLKYLMPTTSPIEEGETTTSTQGLPDTGGDYSVTPLAAVHQLKRLFSNTRRKIRGLDVPVLVFKSEQDSVVPANSLEFIRTSVAAQRLEVVTLVRSSHVATLDVEAGLIAQHSVDFISRMTR
ncbi:alpha/beta hydrolase [Pseudarthrobacter sp. J1738]|uniref:alpha/beta hydrolase n=1 Tax=unclassified Pseudarthrobacter TaxID=2647000 RepID=UPI003D282EA0